MYSVGILKALALEIYFKLLIALSGKSLTRGDHKLHYLFDVIAKDMKDKIRAYAAEGLTAQAQIKRGTMPPVPADFDTVLNLSGDAFSKFRYFYEQRPESMRANEGWCADPILRATRRLIHDLHPDWWQTARVPGTPPTFLAL